jgi:predicted AAA+ superfamily ATPase
MIFLKKEEKDLAGGIIIYGGDEIVKMGDKIFAIPWYMI